MVEENTASGNILSYCSKCKLNLDHIIVTMEQETAAKVQCTTCNSTHKFKNPAVAQKGRASRVKKESGMQPADSALWEAGIVKAKGKERAYTMTTQYCVGDVVIHDTFGKGLVLKLYQNKCDVMFEDKKRLMASAN